MSISYEAIVTATNSAATSGKVGVEGYSCGSIVVPTSVTRIDFFSAASGSDTSPSQLYSQGNVPVSLSVTAGTTCTLPSECFRVKYLVMVLTGATSSSMTVRLGTSENDAGGMSESHIGEVGFNFTTVSAELTRPSDTNAYTARDALSDSTSAPTVAFTFTNIARIAGGSGTINKAVVRTDQKTCVTRFRLHLHNSAPTAINDNAPQTILYANNSSYLGYIDFESCSTEDSTSTAAQAINTSIMLRYVASSRTLYGLLETLDDFTPASGQKIFIALTSANN